MYAEGTHVPGVILDVPEEDVCHFLDNKVGVIATEEVEAPAFPSALDIGKPPVSATLDPLNDDGGSDGDDDVNTEDVLAALQGVPGVTEEIAESFMAYGVTSKESLALYTVEELVTVDGVSQATAEGIVAFFAKQGSAKPVASDKGAKGKGKGKAKA